MDAIWAAGRMGVSRMRATPQPLCLANATCVVTPSRVGWPNKAFVEYNRLLVYFNSNMP